MLERALYFITCNGRMMYPTKIEEEYIVRNLTYQNRMGKGERLPFMMDGTPYRQMSLFDDGQILGESQYRNIS